MNESQKQLVEEIQRLVAKTVALNPAGRNLLLIGGFRLRFLDQSVRLSVDIDYHWSGDLAEKQKELLALFERKLLPEVRRRWGWNGRATALAGPGNDSPAVRCVELAFWTEKPALGRIEIPVEITRIACADPVSIRTADGTIYPTVSDADMIESKIIAILNRAYLRHRDLVDLFLFHNHLLPDSARRLAAKCRDLDITPADIRKKQADFHQHADYHARVIGVVVATQLDTEPAARIQEAGGGKAVLDEVQRILAKLFPGEDGHAGA